MQLRSRLIDLVAALAVQILLPPGPGSAAQIAVSTALTAAGLSAVQFPLTLRTASLSALVRRGPATSQPVLARLPLSTTVAIDSIAAGQGVTQDCVTVARVGGCWRRHSLSLPGQVGTEGY